MTDIRPFRGLRPRQDLVEQVAALPYDVSSAAEVEAKRINPYSFYHITRSEIDMHTGAQVDSQEVYEKAKENLNRFITQGVLIQDEQPCYYIYCISMHGRSQTGLVCCSSLKDYKEGKIKKHEFTRPDRVQDRVNNIMSTGAHTGVVFLAYKEVAEIEHIITTWVQRHPAVYDFVAEDGVGHRFWVVDAPDVIEQLTQLYREKVPATYIADGHHRSHAAWNVAQALDGKQNGDEHQYYLTCIFPDSQVAIMDYNRAVKDLNGMDEATFLNALEQHFIVQQHEGPVKPAAMHQFGMYLAQQWYLIEAKEHCLNHANTLEALGASLLQDHVLKPLLGIADPRIDDRIEFVGGIRGLAYLSKLVDSGECAVAFTCYPVTMQQLFEVADMGEVMPPKSTWFEPKIRDGLVLHLLS